MVYARSITLLVLLFQLCFQHKAQVSFTLPPSACVNSSLVLSANTGSLPAPQITWLTSPNALLSNSLSANTAITFTSAGSYSILLVVISGTNLSFAQNTIQVFANPSPTLQAFPTSVCPLGNFTLTALLPPMGLPSYTFILPGNSPVITGSIPTLPTVAPSSSALPAVYSISVEVAGCSGVASTSVQELSLHPLLSAIPNSICAGFSSTLLTFPSTLSTYTFSVLSPSPVSLATGSSPSIAVSPTQTTLYQVVADSLGCTGSASISIGIGPPLNINISASSPSTCIMSNFPKISNSVTLYAFGGASYIWDPPVPQPGPFPLQNPIIVRPLQTTCFTVTGLTAFCSGSAAICVTVIPQFTFAVSPASASICLGQSLTLVTGSIGPGASGSPSAFTYSWTEAPNAPPISMSSFLTPTNLVFPQNSTTYTVEISDSFSCASQPQTASVTVLACNKLQEVDYQDQPLFFPNPVSNYGELQFKGNSSYTIDIVSVSGEVVIREVSGESSSRILNFEALNNGIYILHLTLRSSKKYTLKIVKQP